MCQLERNFLCRFCPHDERCEEERQKMKEMGEDSPISDSRAGPPI